MQARIPTVLQERRWGLDGPHWPHLTFYLICQASTKLAETAFKGPFKRSRLLPDFSFYTFVERHLGPFDWQICMPLCRKRWKRSKACPVEVDSIVWIGSRFSPTSYDLLLFSNVRIVLNPFEQLMFDFLPLREKKISEWIQQVPTENPLNIIGNKPLPFVHWFNWPSLLPQPQWKCRRFVEIYQPTFVLQEEELHAEIIYKPMIFYCTTDKPYVWLLLVYGFKGILLIFGLFLAWETRKVKIATLNDSRYIGTWYFNVC